VTTDPTATLAAKVLPTVGASKPSRDAVVARIVADVQNRTGSTFTIGAGGPWPTLAGLAPPLDTDRDGMPDSWESTHGLALDDASDGPRTAPNGYTHLENYLNELAGDALP
jgi:hypothetical protein